MINKNKISFIYLSDNNLLVQESIKYVKALNVPEGMEVEIITIEKSDNIIDGFNEAIVLTDAKYKVYLQHDALIINKNFLSDILNIFLENIQLGMIGVIGYKEEEKDIHFGKIYGKCSDKMELHEFNHITNSYESVDVISEFIMITQYDIPITQIETDNYSKHNILHCKQLRELGYEIGVCKQEKPWLLYDNSNFMEVDNGCLGHDTLQKGISLFKKDIETLPLVSILIPTYNRPEYFEVALKSVLAQSYPKIEIIVGDDSTNGETEKLMKRYLSQFNNIRYIKNKNNLGQFENDLMLFREAKGEYINYLMDDDLFHPEKITKMMEYYLKDDKEQIKLVTSHRKMFDHNYQLFEDEGVSTKLFDEDTIIDGIKFGDFALKLNFNCFGEPTTVLFRKKDLKEPFGTFEGRKYGCNVDMASWLNLLSEGKAVYIAETLSFFRIHQGQQLNSKEMRLKGLMDFSHSILNGRIKGFLQDVNDYKKALSVFKKMTTKFFQDIKMTNEDAFLLPLVEQLVIIENELEKCRTDNLLLVNKSKKLPLVSILIPTYNQTHFLKEALESAINQTYPNLEIIIGDDSTNDEVEKFSETYIKKNKNVRYIKNIREEMDYGVSNIRNLLDKCNGEYINFLNHDDIFHKEKISRMMEYFLTREEINIVTSHRQLIDEKGEFLADIKSTQKLFEEDLVIKGEQLSLLCLENISNFIGEPTTVLFKKSSLDVGIGEYFNHKYLNLIDFATWLSLLSKGDAVYITDTLSYFRQHPEQNSHKQDIHLSGISEWKAIIDDSYKNGLITSNTMYTKFISNWFYTFVNIIQEVECSVNNKKLKELKDNFSSAINILLGDKKYHKSCIICDRKLERFFPYEVQQSEFVKSLNIIGSDLDNHSCPHCGCHDRERHLSLYFNKLSMWSMFEGKKILHVAPEQYIAKKIKKLNPLEYFRVDLFPSSDDILEMDITSIPFENSTIDFIICNHVLEHIPNDLTAMKEMYRVLKEGGQAVLQTPYTPLLEKSFEEGSINTPEERLKYYGQDDHVRIYGNDFFKRLQSVGFKLNIVKNSDLFSAEECSKYGVNYNEDLILVSK